MLDGIVAADDHSRPLAPGSLVRIHATLRSALNAAQRRGLLAANPSQLVELPPHPRLYPQIWTSGRVAAWRAIGERPAVAVWTADHLRTFLAAAVGDPLYAAWHLIAFRGLRRGEACGLRWGDVDLDAATVTINQTRVMLGHTVVEGPPKTAASRRVVALDADTRPCTGSSP